MNQALKPWPHHKTYRLCISYWYDQFLFQHSLLEYWINLFFLLCILVELDSKSQSFHEIIFLTVASVLDWFWISIIFSTSVARLARMIQEQTRLTSHEPKVAILGFCLAAPFIFRDFGRSQYYFPANRESFPIWVICSVSGYQYWSIWTSKT